MKKSKTESQQKQDYEKVYEDPLTWCPLFGYLPEISNSNISKHPIIVYGELSTVDIAHECLDMIKEARKYWGIAHCDLVENDPCPEFKILPTKKDSKGHEYEYHRYVNKIIAARVIFNTIHRIFLGDTFYNMAQYSIFEGYDNSTSMQSQWGGVGVLDKPPENLLHNAQAEIGEDYKIHLDELYSLYAIFETWYLLVGLFRNKYKDNDADKAAIYDRMDYVDKLLKTAEIQGEKQLLIAENKAKTLRIEYASLVNKTKADNRWAVDKLKIEEVYKTLERSAKEICRELYDKKHKIEAKDIARKIKKRLNCKQKVDTIRKNHLVVLVVNKYKALNK